MILTRKTGKIQQTASWINEIVSFKGYLMNKFDWNSKKRKAAEILSVRVFNKIVAGCHTDFIYLFLPFLNFQEFLLWQNTEHIAFYGQMKDESPPAWPRYP